ncbi:MAG TPA: flagellar hook-associated protein FlgK [Oscillospiraceae bacterium]|nr:flagellar hook-associated protein FlgK [Oscillospiraceae bacterium]
MRSTFSGFYIARSGIQAARANLQITGQNMANVNTDGYTRQRVNTSAIPSAGNNMRYSNHTDAAIGQGVSTDGTSQIRDPFLDVRFRRQNAKVGDTTAQMNALGDVEDVVDETSNDGLQKQLKDFISKLQTLSGNAGDKVTESIVKTSASMLAKMFNNTANQIQNIKDQQLSYLQDNAVESANQLLSNIAKLNTEIKSADVSGSPALELMDQRNTMLDKLSAYANIEVDSNTVSVGSGRTVAELSINLIGKNGEKYNLVDNDKYSQFSLKKDPSTGLVNTDPVEMQLNTSTGTPVVSTESGTAVSFSNNQLTSGSFHGYLAVLNGKGDYDTSAATSDTHDSTSAKGIPYYQNMMDTLANKFASIMNAANSTNTDGVGYNKPMFTTADGKTTGTYIDPATGNTMGEEITAANISISNAWSTATTSYITNTKSTLDPSIDNSKSANNILYMINQFSTAMTFTTKSDGTGSLIFKGTLQDGITNFTGTLGLQIQDISRQNTTYTSELSSISNAINENSAVSVDEEGINLIMYNQALTASSRFMTTLDQALDTIINKMGVVGT